MIPPKYKFYIAINSNELGTEVTPYYKTLSKKYAKESNQAFFRASLDGKITLVGTDYALIKNADIESTFRLTIRKYKETDKAWYDYYTGTFSKTDCTFDLDKKLCEIKTETLDEYTDIMNGYENTYDLIKLKPAITRVYANKRMLIQVYIRGGSTISNFFGGTYWEDDVYSTVDDADELINKYHFSLTANACEFNINYTGIDVSQYGGFYTGVNGIWYNKLNHTCKYIIKYNINDVYPFDSTKKIYDIASDANRTILTVERDNVTYFDERVYVFVIIDSNGTTVAESSELYYNTGGHVSISSARANIGIPFCKGTSVLVINSAIEYNVYQRMLCSKPNVQGTDTYKIGSDDFAANNTNYKYCVGLKGGDFYCTAAVTDEPTKFGINDYGEYFTDQFIPAVTGIERPMPVCRSTWGNASLWVSYNYSYTALEQNARQEYAIRDCYSIADAISALLTKIAPGITHEATAEYSRFLYDTSVPITMNRFYVFIAPKSNVLKGNYDQAAQKAELSFKSLMEMLRNCFRCYWFIEDGKLRIEHISYFMRGGSYSTVNTVQYDLTNLKDQFTGKSLAYFQASAEYDKTELTKRYEFNWADDSTELFSYFNIDVDSNYIQKDKTDEINISNFSADLDYMLFKPDEFNKDGFALLCPTKSGSKYTLPIITTTLRDESDNNYTAIVQNYYASFINLLRFYMYDMPAQNIISNKLDTLIVYDTKKCMGQTVVFPSEEDPELYKLIKTSIGSGNIEDMTVNIGTRTVEAKLTYKPQ